MNELNLNDEDENVQDCEACDEKIDGITLEELVENDPDIFMFKQNNHCFCFTIDPLYEWVYVNPENHIHSELPIQSTNPLTGGVMNGAILNAIKVKYRARHPPERVQQIPLRGREAFEHFMRLFNPEIDIRRYDRFTNRQLAQAARETKTEMEELVSETSGIPEEELRMRPIVELVRLFRTEKTRIIREILVQDEEFSLEELNRLPFANLVNIWHDLEVQNIIHNQNDFV